MQIYYLIVTLIQIYYLSSIIVISSVVLHLCMLHDLGLVDLGLDPLPQSEVF